LTIAFVKWVDSAGHSGQIPKHEKLTPIVVESAGILVEHTDDYVTIAQDWFEDLGEHRCLMSIPWCCVKEYKIVRPE
jgi:hypothetical protein